MTCGRKLCLPHQLYYPVLDIRDRVRSHGQRGFSTFLETCVKPRSAIIYVHIPFCRTICEFCTFDRSNSELAARIPPYLSRLHDEINQFASTSYAEHATITGVHIGGGTPSVLNVDDFRALVDLLRVAFRLTPKVPIDLEVAIPTLTEEKIATYRALGIRKVSFGVQTFDSKLRGAMKLNSSRETIRSWADRLRETGFIVFLDLIYNLPGQDAAVLRDDVRLAVELQPDGIEHSQYYPFGSPYWAHAAQNPVFMSSEVMAPALSAAWRDLEASGYTQKSSYMFCRRDDNMLDFAYHGDPATAKPPLDCIGLGASAYGFVGPFHYRNLWQDWYTQHDAREGLPLVHLACSDPDALQDRRVVLFPRVLALSKSTVDASTLDRFRDPLDLLREEELIAEDAESIRLTPQGRIFFDNVMWSLYPGGVRERLADRVWRTD